MISAARWAASWALSVKRSNRIMGFCVPFPASRPDRSYPHLSHPVTRAERDDSLSGICGDLSGLLRTGDYNKTALAVCQRGVRGVLEFGWLTAGFNGGRGDKTLPFAILPLLP